MSSETYWMTCSLFSYLRKRLERMLLINLDVLKSNDKFLNRRLIFWKKNSVLLPTMWGQIPVPNLPSTPTKDIGQLKFKAFHWNNWYCSCNIISGNSGYWCFFHFHTFISTHEYLAPSICLLVASVVKKIFRLSLKAF